MKYNLRFFLIVAALLPPILALAWQAVQRHREYERERHSITIIQP